MIPEIRNQSREEKKHHAAAYRDMTPEYKDKKSGHDHHMPRRFDDGPQVAEPRLAEMGAGLAPHKRNNHAQLYPQCFGPGAPRWRMLTRALEHVTPRLAARRRD